MNPGVLKTLEKKYFQRDEQGQLIEHTPEEMFRRVAKAVASVEKEEDREYWEEVFFNMMNDMYFLPSSPVMMNAGTNIKALAACYLLDIEDSRQGIGQTLLDAMEIFASGGGCGFPFSKIRAKGTLVKSTHGKASGPVSFMEMYNAMTGTILQGGKRRGASSATLLVTHPDILEFINVKRDKTKLTNFNLSVLLTDEFMKAAENNEYIMARDPKTGEPCYFNMEKGFDTAHGDTGKINAGELLNQIIKGGWLDGEPGVYFIDNAHKANPFPYEDEEFRLLGSNPCFETVLRDGESCVLGSINLTKFFCKGHTDYSLTYLSSIVKTAIRFLDNIVTLSIPPLEKIRTETLKTRKVGLGIMGLHDMLLIMGLPYSLSKSPSTRKIVNQVMGIIRNAAIEASVELAEERGVFPAYDKSTFIIPRRNACLLSVAPTGTLARIADVSFGMEPSQFFEVYNNLTDTQYKNVHPLAKPYLDRGEKLPSFFEEAKDITPEDHIDMQILIQSFTDQAVSKTILLPNNFPIEKLLPLYIRAWKGGLKGFTIYRDGSRSDQPISDASTPVLAVPEEAEHYRDQVISPELNDNFHKERERTTTLYGPSYKVVTPEGNAYIDIHHNEDLEVCEIMLQLGDGFTDTEKALANWAARLMSKALQHGMDYSELVKQGASTEFEHKSRAYPGRVFWFGTNGKKRAYRSIPEVASDLIIQQVNKIAYGTIDEPQEEIEEEDHLDTMPLISSTSVVCPECNTPMQYVEGCYSCDCGYSKCG